ncbi:MAG: hypothetical protein IVW56_08630 [Candidatus Binataceae bacterium]|nr:hypothetical protein [Candidatus Binataceae bacterium]
MSTRSISTRVPQEIADQLAAEARRRSVTESDLIREIIAARYLDASRSAMEPRPKIQSLDEYAQLIFEVAKTRSVILHSLDHTLGAEVVDEIIDTAEQTAKEHVAQVLKSEETQS